MTQYIIQHSLYIIINSFEHVILFASANHWFHSPNFPRNTLFWYWIPSPNTKNWKRDVFLLPINERAACEHLLSQWSISISVQLHLWTRLQVSDTRISYVSLSSPDRIFISQWISQSPSILNNFCLWQVKDKVWIVPFYLKRETGGRGGGENSFPRITADLKEDMKPPTLNCNLY